MAPLCSWSIGRDVPLYCAGCGSNVHAGSNSSAATASLVVRGDSTVTLGKTARFVATISGTAASPTWLVNLLIGGSSTFGTIDGTGKYAPPASVPTSNVVRVETVDSKTQQSTSVGVTVFQPAPVINSANFISTDGAMTATFTVIGTGFSSNAVLLVDGKLANPTGKADAILVLETAEIPRSHQLSVAGKIQNLEPKHLALARPFFRQEDILPFR